MTALRYPRMPEPQRLAAAMAAVATVHAIIDLAARLPAPMREPVIREAHTMLVARYRDADARYGIGHTASGSGAG